MFINVIFLRSNKKNIDIAPTNGLIKMDQSKPRIIKDFEKLDPELQEQIKLTYPDGFSQHLINFKNKEGQYVSALTFETEDRYYLLRMTVQEAVRIIELDDDYDDDGQLKEVVQEEYQGKHGDFDDMADDYDDNDLDNDDDLDDD